MGPDTAICRTFNLNGEFYQLRVEIRMVNKELYALWFINYFRIIKLYSIPRIG
jgi:hypothetical protein